METGGHSLAPSIECVESLLYYTGVEIEMSKGDFVVLAAVSIEALCQSFF